MVRLGFRVLVVFGLGFSLKIIIEEGGVLGGWLVSDC